METSILSFKHIDYRDSAISCNRQKHVLIDLDFKNLESIRSLVGGDFITAYIKKMCIENTAVPKGTMDTYNYISKSKTVVHYPKQKKLIETTPFDENMETSLQDLDKSLNRQEPAIALLSTTFFLGEKTDLSANHFTTVIGRKYNNSSKQCEYHLRSSFGTNCSIYKPEVKANCIDGNIWIGEKDLRKYLKDVTTFTPQK